MNNHYERCISECLQMESFRSGMTLLPNPPSRDGLKELVRVMTLLGNLTDEYVAGNSTLAKIMDMVTLQASRHRLFTFVHLPPVECTRWGDRHYAILRTGWMIRRQTSLPGS